MQVQVLTKRSVRESFTQDTVVATDVVHPLIGCLLEAEGVIGKSDWRPFNDFQKSLLHRLAHNRDLSAFEKELQSIASFDVDEINRFLEDSGFSISLNPFTNPQSFGVASVLVVNVQWKKKGEEEKVFFGGKAYPAVRQKGFLARSRAHNEPIVAIETQNGDTVFLTKAPHPLKSDELYPWVKEVSGAVSVSGSASVIFPCASLHQTKHLHELLDMEIDDGKYFIGQALQETKFKLDLLGAKVESAAAMELVFRSVRLSESETVVIDHPFVCWIRRNGIIDPYFMGYIPESAWKL